jgi:hypothetical protein
MTAVVVATLCVNDHRVYAAVRDDSAVWGVVATRRGRSWDIRAATDRTPDSVVRRLMARVPMEHRIGSPYDRAVLDDNRRSVRAPGAKATCEAVRRLLVGR